MEVPSVHFELAAPQAALQVVPAVRVPLTGIATQVIAVAVPTAGGSGVADSQEIIEQSSPMAEPAVTEGQAHAAVVPGNLQSDKVQTLLAKVPTLARVPDNEAAQASELAVARFVNAQVVAAPVPDFVYAAEMQSVQVGPV